MTERNGGEEETPKGWTLPQNWKEEESVKRWLSNVKQEKASLWSLKNFLISVQMTPTQLIEMRTENLKSEDLDTKYNLEIMLKRYIEGKYKEGVKVNTGRKYLTGVQSFLKANGLRTDFRGPVRVIHRERQDVMENHKAPFVLTNVQSRQMINQMNSNFEKGLFLTMYQSGLSANDVKDLKVTNQLLSDISEKRHSYIEKARGKSRILQQTFISDEGLFYIGLYLNERKNGEVGDYLFLTRKGETIDSKFLTRKYKLIAIRTFGEDLGKRFQISNLRDCMLNASQQVGLESEYTNRLCGWKDTGAKGNYYLNEETMRIAYEKIIKVLSINGYTKSREQFRDLSDNVLRLEQENRDLRTSINAILKDLEGLKEDQANSREYINILHREIQEVKGNPTRNEILERAKKITEREGK